MKDGNDWLRGLALRLVALVVCVAALTSAFVSALVVAKW